jgi:ferredoxin-NADP reductase
LGARPGQFLTFDWIVNGKKLPRSYSISSSPLETGFIEVTVKEQGIVSSFLNRDARVGLTVAAHGPFGQFYFNENFHRRVVLIAGGSGITPIMSMLRYIEATSPGTEVLLLYGVRSQRDIIFKEELERLRELARFQCVIVPSRQVPGKSGGAPGRLDRERITQEVGQITDQFFFLCGPAGFMASITDILTSMDVRADHIRQERFATGMGASTEAEAPTYIVEFVRSGERFAAPSTESLLLVAEGHGIDIPYSCRVGQCGTCATRVLDGEVDMETEAGLDSERRSQGYRLMCIGRARSNVRLDA